MQTLTSAGHKISNKIIRTREKLTEKKNNKPRFVANILCAHVNIANQMKITI